MRKYPIGIQSFEKLRKDGYLYVDKTSYIKQLAEEGSVYFLSRPRRFGKSLFLDTMQHAFEGRKELFGGLYLENNWDWDTSCPVLKISLGSGVFKNVNALNDTFNRILNQWADEFDIEFKSREVNNRFYEVLYHIHKKTQKGVVVLIDEYDKPILDNITNRELAMEIREELKNFYSVLKDADGCLKLVFITGVSKFSKVSLFSGLNNLKDITINKKYSSICGYTQDELETNFSEELENYDTALIKEWYNGYSWGNGTVYNPFDLLQFFDDGTFRNYWFESGTPAFLIRLFEENGYFIPDLECIEASESIASSFEIEQLNIETLLFQTGYLTIKKIETFGTKRTYLLGYPNLEVKMSLNDALLEHCSLRASQKEKNVIALYRLLEANNLDGLRALFYSFFASIPHDWFRKNNIEEYEGFYASVFYAYFCALGLDLRVEDATNHGKIDMTVLFQGRCYIFEFKLANSADSGNAALKQIEEKKYAEKYTSEYKDIYMIGAVFDKKSRNITEFGWKKR